MNRDYGHIAKPAIKANKEIIAEGVETLLKQTDEVAEQAATEAAEKAAQAEAERIAKGAAEKAVKEQAEKISKRYDELNAHGHGPARHGQAITKTQLDDRVMYGKDPITGTTDDAFRKDASGNPLPHKSGKDATQFTSKEALVKADEHIQNLQAYKDALSNAENNNLQRFSVEDIKLEDIFGTKYKDVLFGKTRVGSRNHPTGTVETDFTDGTVKAVFQKDASGNWNLHTMYPEPKN